MGNNMNRRPVNNRNFTQNNMRNSNNDGNPPCDNTEATCKELMRAIMEADFFAQDLKLYLDTHPDDTRALEMYREAVRQTKACSAAFEDSFYPLTASSAGLNGTWDWLDGTFPPLS